MAMQNIIASSDVIYSHNKLDAFRNTLLCIGFGYSTEHRTLPRYAPSLNPICCPVSLNLFVKFSSISLFISQSITNKTILIYYWYWRKNQKSIPIAISTNSYFFYSIFKKRIFVSEVKFSFIKKSSLPYISNIFYITPI